MIETVKPKMTVREHLDMLRVLPSTEGEEIILEQNRALRMVHQDRLYPQDKD